MARFRLLFFYRWNKLVRNTRITRVTIFISRIVTCARKNIPYAMSKWPTGGLPARARFETICGTMSRVSRCAGEMFFFFFFLTVFRVLFFYLFGFNILIFFIFFFFCFFGHCQAPRDCYTKCKTNTRSPVAYPGFFIRGEAKWGN